MNRLKASLVSAAALLSLVALSVIPNLTTSAVVAQKSGELYYPGPDEKWERRTPQQVGMDPARLNEAIAFAQANETKASRIWSWLIIRAKVANRSMMESARLKNAEIRPA
jgi:hypothetical protein